MNWLPQPSRYEELQAARAKRREHARDFIAQQQALAGAFGSNLNSAVQGQVDLAIRVAHSRLLAQPAKTDKTA